MTRAPICLALLLGAALAALPGAPGRAEITADPTGPIVTVSDPAALTQAYLDLSAWAAGGGTIVIAPEFPREAEIALSGGGPHPVHITAADPGTPARVSRIALDGVENLRLSRLHVDGSGIDRPEFWRDINIEGSARIEIVDSVFTSNGSTVFDPDDAGTILGERLSMIRGSEILTVTGNFFAGHEQGLTFQESSHIRVIGNEFTAIQGDGLRLVGVVDVLVQGNYMHDFSSTPSEFTHSDFIQMWSTNAETMSRDVVIDGNVLDTGNGHSIQAIWMRNEAHDRGDTDHIYRNITVTNNLIYTGSANGIGIGQADGVLVEGNTVLWNQDAFVRKETGDTSYPPRIRLHADITNALVRNNITTRITHGDGAVLDGNVLLSWRQGEPNYAGNHFVDVAQGGDIGPDGWRLLPGSPFVGVGSEFSQPLGGSPG